MQFGLPQVLKYNLLVKEAKGGRNLYRGSMGEGVWEIRTGFLEGREGEGWKPKLMDVHFEWLLDNSI